MSPFLSSTHSCPPFLSPEVAPVAALAEFMVAIDRHWESMKQVRAAGWKTPADHPDTTAQAQRLGAVLKEAGIPVTVFGGKETNHNKINADLGLPDDPATKALFDFVGNALKK